jgi:hypothetical protein
MQMLIHTAVSFAFMLSYITENLLFCISVNHYQITLQSGSASAQTRGVVTVTLVGTLQTVSVTFDKYVYEYNYFELIDL